MWQSIESSTWHIQCHLILTLNLEGRVFLFPFCLWVKSATERIRNLPQMTQLKCFNPKSPVSKTCVPVCDAAPGLWSGLGMRQRVRASHRPTTWKEFCSSEGRLFFLVLFPHIRFSSRSHCMCCSECSFSPAGVIWRAGGFIVMWGNVICSSGGLFHRHCQLDTSNFQWETGPWLEGISEQEQLSLQPRSVPSSVQVPAAPSGSWIGCWPWPASRGTWQWWSSWSWPTGPTRRATQSGRTSSLSSCACHCTRPSSQVGPG